jgi:3-oxoacyl-[acyl-carrier protein] reductase
MADDLCGRSAIVTGAARGIGLATARHLARQGMRVGCLDIDGAALNGAVAALRATGAEAEAIVADIADRAAVRQAIEDFATRGAISVLVNNAAVVHFRPVDAIEDEELDRMIAVGVKGALWCVQAALPSLRRAAADLGDAAIVNVASAAAVQGPAGSAAYTAVKGALAALTRQLAVELGYAGIRVNAVAPGPIPTEYALSSTPDPAGWRARTERKTPLGRMGTAEEVASAIALLASPAARWINGEIVVVDGGKSIAAHDRPAD